MKQPNQNNVQTHNIFEENSKQKRSILVAQLEDLNRRRKSKTIRWLFLLLPLFFAVIVTYTHYEVYNQLSIPIIIFAVIITFLLSGFLFIYFNYMLEMRENRIRRAIFELDAVYSQNKIDEDIFKNSIEMSYKYLDQYYSQTREHAQRGFFVTVCVAVFGALLIGTGILSMFFGTTQPAYITCASGVVTELIATVFFYLYNKTVSSMSNYHNKLVLSQNISIALKVADSLPEEENIKTKNLIVAELIKDINTHLIRSDPSSPSKPD